MVRVAAMVGGTILVVIILPKVATLGVTLRQCKGSNFC
jgi:hypothetical protein